MVRERFPLCGLCAWAACVPIRLICVWLRVALLLFLGEREERACWGGGGAPLPACGRVRVCGRVGVPCAARFFCARVGRERRGAAVIAALEFNRFRERPSRVSTPVRCADASCLDAERSERDEREIGRRTPRARCFLFYLSLLQTPDPHVLHNLTLSAKKRDHTQRGV